MTHQHTPGPWRNVENRAVQIGTSYFIHPCQHHSGPVEIKPADANLIAAAPDLLVALEDVLNMVEEPEGPYYHGARRALAKALGY